MLPSTSERASSFPYTARVRATLHDAEGPWQRRYLGMGIALVLGLAASLCSLASIALAPALMILAFAIALVSRPLTRRALATDVEVVCTKGRVVISGGALQNRRIKAKDITGATTARHGSKQVLSLALRGREGKPIHLVLASEEEVKSVCDALGIGHGGFGAVGFTLRARPRDLLEAFVRIVAAGCWSTFAYFMATNHAGSTIGVVSVLALNAATVLMLMRRAPSPQLVLRADGAHVGTGRRWSMQPYTAFAQASASRDAILVPNEAKAVRILSPPSRWLPDGMSIEEKEILVSQLKGGAARAFGQGAIKDEGPATLASLRRDGASVEQWRGHLDALAASLAQSGGAYRGGTLEAADLWRVVEDPDANPEQRMAATRVLAKLDEKAVAVRVAPLLDTVRDEGVRKRIRVAMEPDGAVFERELLAIEAHELLLEMKR